MKFYLLPILFMLSFNCDAQWYKKRYEDQLEPKSKVISAEYNFSVEKVNDTLYLYKDYFTGNMQMTSYISFSDKKLEVKNGLFKRMYDDGTLVAKGHYHSNEKEGFWYENDKHGRYKNGKRVGKWQSLREDSTLIVEMNYLDDKLNGRYIAYDSTGNVEYEELYEFGELIESTKSDVAEVVEEMPRFPGCEDQGLEGKELKTCADTKMLTYVYSNLRYPKNAREYGVEGIARFQFVVDKEGNIVDIKTLWGLSGEIKKECLKLIKSMPKWRPGYKNGEPVKVMYTLPIRFKLEG